MQLKTKSKINCTFCTENFRGYSPRTPWKTANSFLQYKAVIDKDKNFN